MKTLPILHNEEFLDQVVKKEEFWTCDLFHI